MGKLNDYPYYAREWEGLTEKSDEEMNRRKFLALLSVFMMLPLHLWAKEKRNSDVMVREGWILKKSDI